MSIFRSQFDRARPYAQAYAGDSGDPSWRTPALAAAAVAGAGVVAIAAAGETEPGWGDGWDAGWEAPAVDPGGGSDDGSAWLDRGDYTDAGVGGDDDFFYFIDGDSSLAVG
jgi:transcription elongation factor